MDTKKVEFPVPRGFQTPEGMQKGSRFDAVCTFEVKDGTLCMVMLGETPMPGYDKGGEQNHPKPDYGEYSKSMPQPGMEQPAESAGGKY